MKRKIIIILVIILCISSIPVSVFGYANNGYENSSFYAFMSYKRITARASNQYVLNYSDRAYTDSNGLRRLSDQKGVQRSDDPYIVAIGTAHNAPVGTKFQATIGGITRNYVVGDIKADQHTDATNTYTVHSGKHCVIEYIVDGDALGADAWASGNIGSIPGFSGDITHMNFPSVDAANNYVNTIVQEEGLNGMPTDVIETLFGHGSSYGEYVVKEDGKLGYNHWESFDIEGGSGIHRFASSQMQRAVYYSEMDNQTFSDFTNGLRLPSCGICEDIIVAEDELSQEIITDPTGGGGGESLGMPVLNGAGAMLDMPLYINQGAAPQANVVRCRRYNKNVLETCTIKMNGCLDCSLAMAYIYYYGSSSTDVVALLKNKISCHICNADNPAKCNGSLNTPVVLKELGMNQGANTYPHITYDTQGGRHLVGWSGLISCLESGNPVLMHIKGHWEGYHTSSNGHFLLATGYDENGIYVYDPGKRSNTESGQPIPWAAWARAAQMMGSDLYYRTLSPTRDPHANRSTVKSSAHNWNR